MIIRRYIFLLLSSFLLSVVHLSAAATADRFSGTVDIGFDSFTEKYSIVEEDTVDNTVEFRSRIAARYLYGMMFGDFLQVEAQSITGNNGIESIGRILGAKSLARTKMGFDAYLTGKSFFEGTSYAYPNDYLRLNGKLYFVRRIGDYSTVSVSERVERIDFEERTEFDYDFVRSSTTVSADYLTPLSTSLHTGITAAVKSIPDSTEISYSSYSATVEYGKEWESHRSVSFTAIGERRSYAHKPVRSPYWSVFTRLKTKPVIRPPWELVLEHESESYIYDTSTDIYFDYMENRFAALFCYFRNYVMEAGLGPIYSMLSSDQSANDLYREFGARAVFEFTDTGRLWLSASYEFGKRRYDAYHDNPAEAIFSDYFFNRFSVFSNWKPVNTIGLNAFVSYEPRNYQRAGDDTSTALFSLSVSYYF